MHKTNQVSGWILLILLPVSYLFACKKENENKIYTPVPFLTGRTWIADTMTVNPPLIFSQLSSADQQSLQQANGWFKIAKLTLNEDGTVSYYGDYDFGYKTWRLINNNLDIEMTISNGSKKVLRNWFADATRFSYTIPFNTTFECTAVYK